MRSVSITINRKTKLLIVVSLLLTVGAFSQENSPYSRYGMGDLVPSASIWSRSMGGIAAGLVDYDKRYDLKQIYPKSQTVNFLNPASYSRQRITTFGLGFEIDQRTIIAPQSGDKFKSTNAILSYLEIGIPLSRKHNWGMNIGLRPISRISYKIESAERLYDPNTHLPIDSAKTLYQGSGGSYQAFVGVGKAFKNFSIGFNTGYFFGTKDYSTRRIFINDSVLYYKSNHENVSSFGGLFYNAGIQYAIKLNKKTSMVLGAYGTLNQSFKAHLDRTVETFDYDANGAVYRIDSVYGVKDSSGTLETPQTFSIGFVITREDKWMLGADFSTTKWEDYSYFGQTDNVQNSWIVRIGGQVTPNAFNAKSYWSRVTYRAGINFGQDYIVVDNDNLPQFGFSAGFGLPVRKSNYTNQYTNINLGFEYGKRGNTNNMLRETTFKLTLGLTLSDLWFVKRKYE